MSEFHSSEMYPGFTLSFENGWEVSVQWGTDHYCSNRKFQRVGNRREDMPRESFSYDEEADKVYQQDVSTVTGHLTTDHVASIITQVSHFKRSEKANQKVESQDTVEHGAKSA
jgi:hypothetical protein